MIATCVRCHYTDQVKLRSGAVVSFRLERNFTRQNLPDVFICTLCMEEIL